MAPTDQTKLSVVALGHLASGKSTALGHLLHLNGSISSKEMAQLTEKSANNQVNYAWLFDKLSGERERGSSIDSHMRSFETSSHAFNVIDTPGEKKFMKNAICSISQADVAIIFIAADAIEQNQIASTRDFVLVAFTFGIKQLIIVVNKMDTIAYSQDKFHRLQEMVEKKVLMKVGYKPGNIPFVPVCGLEGDNLKIQNTTTMSWYSGSTLLGAFGSLTSINHDSAKPLRMPIDEVCKIKGVGVVITGRVVTGTLKPGMKITIGPNNYTSTVKSIQMNYRSISQANAGDNIGFCLESQPDNGEVRRGFVVSDSDNDPAQNTESFVAQVVILDHPGHISNGFTPIIDCHTTHVACKFKKITRKIDRITGKTIETAPKFVKSGDACMVVLEPTKPLSIESFSTYSQLGRFTIRDMNNIVAVGVVKSVVKKEYI